MRIQSAGLENYLILVSKKGFILVNCNNHFIVSIRLRAILRLAHGIEHETGGRSITTQASIRNTITSAIVAEIPRSRLIMRTLREVCAQLEFKSIQAFYESLTPMEKTEFNTFTGGLDRFIAPSILAYHGDNGNAG